MQVTPVAPPQNVQIIQQNFNIFYPSENAARDAIQMAKQFSIQLTGDQVENFKNFDVNTTKNEANKEFKMNDTQEKIKISR